ncbi:hypothetical protein P22_2396 [Propionispora sp. 2/2-37]|uniref:substrate-binding domain-containing protein n=1 Tax=Propionispora sp. 2/2-37 TaxID=1677858 RepID=UPI0006C2FE6B|nr:substrate-binding domain-containing protein [Propionispora sp. 2/2-37]CUH96306.1 hypothetical protein P22_2396 [Propionispora sp. 2/2-37]
MLKTVYYRYIQYIIVLAVVTLAVFSIMQYWQNRSSSEECSSPVKFLIGVSQANLIEPWRVAMNEEIKKEALAYKDVRVVFSDAAQSSDKQIRDVEALLQQGIDLLIISPNDSAKLTPIVSKAYKKIPVIVLDRAVEGADYTLFIGPDNKFIGKEAGRYVLDLLRSSGGKVVEIQGLAGSPPVRERSEGFREVLKNYPQIEIVKTMEADWQKDKAEDKMAEILTRSRDIDIVFAHNDPMALGAYQAVKKAGGIPGIKFIGVDGLSGPGGGLQLVRDGVLKGTYTCSTGGKEAVRYAIDILNHEKGVPKKIILRSNKITADNLAEYLQNERQVAKDPSHESRKIRIGFSQLGRESEWRMANSDSIKRAAADARVELFFEEADQKQERQIAAIRSFIAMGVDIIAFSPVIETGWDEVLQEAKQANIPVILMDRTIKVEDDSLYSSFIGADFQEEGRKAARWLMNNTKELASVNIVELQGTLGAAPSIDRKQGFAEVIQDNKKYRIVYSEIGDFTKASGKKIMQDILARETTDIQAVFAHNDDMALGAIEALEEYHLRPGRDIMIVSIDATKSAFEAMLQGKLNCTVECNPLLGPELMKAAKDRVSGKQLPIKIIAAESIFPQEVASQEYKKRKY